MIINPTVLVYGVNIGSGPNLAKLNDLELMAELGADAILGNEFADRRELKEMFLKKLPWWSIFEGDRLGEKAVPIFYNRRTLRRVSGSVIEGWSGGFLGPEGPGQNFINFKALTRGNFRIKGTSETFKLLNHHCVAGAFSTHGEEKRRRQEAWSSQVNSFFGSVSRSKRRVIGGVDWNAEKTNPLLKRLTPAGWVWDTHRDTKGNRGVDMLGHRRSDFLGLLDSGVLDTSGSQTREDHKAVWGVYKLK